MIALVGYRGTGKSTVAQALAGRLGWAWADADHELEARVGCSVRELFQTQGEPAFRDWEERILEELLTRSRTVLATGGGVVVRPANRRRLKATTVVWLTATPETIAARLSADATTGERRPSLTGMGSVAEILPVLTQRLPWYQDVAAKSVPTDDRPAEAIADEIAQWYRSVSPASV